MIPEYLRTMIQKAFRAFGLEIHRTDISSSGRNLRGALPGLLKQVKARGFAPATIIDVGAAYGAFTRQCLTVFPDAKCILVEPLAEYAPFLERVVGSMQNAEYVLAVAAAQPGERTINVHPDLVGSSLYREVEEGSGVNGFPRSVQAVTLDRLVKKTKAKAPFLLKADVQGAELDVLRGAEETLRNTEYVLLEVSFFEFFKDGPEFYDVVAFMNSKGFVPYDMCGLQYRPLDGALSQVDIAFVQEAGLFRQHHYYATPAQREEQNRKIQARSRKPGKIKERHG